MATVIAASTVALQSTTPSPKSRAMAVSAERTAEAVAPRRRRVAARRRPPKPRSQTRDRLEYVALRAVMGALAMLPLVAALRIGEVFAFAGYVLDVPHRRIGMRNLAIA